MKWISFLLFYTQLFYSQSIRLEKKIDLPKKVSETSGLIFFNQEVVTFNDSGGKAELYVVNPTSGKIRRTVYIKNAQNIDWESITQDEQFIYVGDTGNNSGKRTTLIVYKILKEKFLECDNVTAQEIKFSYENLKQVAKKNRGDYFDCEAITYYEKSILIFTKNRKTKNTHIYQIPNTKGVYVAKEQQQININCLLTSVDYNPKNRTLIGTAYDENYKPSVIVLENFKLNTSKFDKISLKPLLKRVNQIEGIAWAGSDQFYISRELSKKKIKGNNYQRKQKLLLFSLKK